MNEASISKMQITTTIESSAVFALVPIRCKLSSVLVSFPGSNVLSLFVGGFLLYCLICLRFYYLFPWQCKLL